MLKWRLPCVDLITGINVSSVHLQAASQHIISSRLRPVHTGLATGQFSTNPNMFWVKGSYRSKRYVDRCSRRMLLRHCCGCQTLDLSSCIDHSVNHMKGNIFFWIARGTETRVPLLNYATVPAQFRQHCRSNESVSGQNELRSHSSTDLSKPTTKVFSTQEKWLL